MKQIDNTQKKLIHIAKAQLKLSDEEYRTMLSERYWVNSCKSLAYDDAHALIEHFKTLGFKVVTKKYERRKTAPNLIRLVSKQQLAKIEHLKEDIRWIVKPDGYQRWLKKYLKQDPARIATSKQANAVIEALKSMRERQQKTLRQAQDEPGGQGTPTFWLAPASHDARRGSGRKWKGYKEGAGRYDFRE